MWTYLNFKSYNFGQALNATMGTEREFEDCSTGECVPKHISCIDHIATIGQILPHNHSTNYTHTTRTDSDLLSVVCFVLASRWLRGISLNPKEELQKIRFGGFKFANQGASPHCHPLGESPDGGYSNVQAYWTSPT